MGQVESSDVDSIQDTHASLSRDVYAHSRRVSGPPVTAAGGAGRLDGGSGVQHHAGHPAYNNVVTHNERARTESESTGGYTSSAGTDPSIPAIVISECSDAETDIEFDPAFFHTSERRQDFVNGAMELNVTPHESDRRPSRIRIVSKQGNKQSGANQETQASIHKRGSLTDVSETSVSSKDSKKSKTKKEKPEKQKKKSLFGKKDKGSLSDRWGNVVNEFESSHKPKKEEPKKGRRVSKLSMEQYDNVKQVFSRSMPLPMQTAPPGASASEMELDTVAVGAYNSGKPSLSSSPHISAQPVINQRTRSISVSKQIVPPATAAKNDPRSDRRKSRIEAERVIKEESTQEFTTTGGGRAGSVSNIRSGSVANLRSGSVANVKSGSVANVQQSQAKNGGISASQASNHSKKGVKFRSKSLTIEDKAQIVVDDAIRAALELLGYKNASSYSSSHKKSTSSLNQRDSRETRESRESINRSSISKTLSEKVSIEERERLASAERAKEADYRQTQDNTRYGQFINNDHRSEYNNTSYYERRKSSVSPRYHGNRRMSRMRILPGSLVTGTGLKPANSLGDLYDMTIQPHTEKPQDPESMPRSAYVTTNTMVRLYGDKGETKSSFVSDANKTQSETAINRASTPPTITRGTVTRVLHGLDNETRRPKASQLLSELRTEENHDYSTWPLARAEKSETNINLGEIGDDVTVHSLPEGGTLGLSFEQQDEQLRRVASTGNLTLVAELPEHYTLHHSPTVHHFNEDEFIITRRAHSADNLLDMPAYNDYNAPLSLQSGTSAPIYFMGPHGNFVPVYQGGQDAYYTEAEQGGAYSNEPIIVADLMDKPGHHASHTATFSPGFSPNAGLSHRSYSEPAINMNKQQSLNLYLFNRPETKSVDVSFESQPPHDYDYEYDYDYDYNQDNYDEYDYDDTGMKEVTIFHKQTQTMPPPKPKKKPPIIKKIERREKPRPVPVPIYLPKPKHKETTHYITKERQIERLPPKPVPKSTFSTQTDVHRGHSATQTDPKPRKPKVDRVEFTRTFQPPTVREMREMIGSSESRPPKPIPENTRDITVGVKPSYFDMDQVIERERQSQIVKQEQEVAPPPDDEDSEEEMHELIEIEEKEQRVAMSIFEEFEFHFQRKEDDRVTSQSGKASDLVPWIYPDKYEAIVDHRKQKSTQIREVDRTGAHSYHNVHPIDGKEGVPKAVNQTGHQSSQSKASQKTHNQATPNYTIQHNRSAKLPGQEPVNYKNQSYHSQPQNDWQQQGNGPEVAMGSSKETITQNLQATWGVPGKSPPGYAAAHSQAFRQEFVQKERNTSANKAPMESSAPLSSGYSSADSVAHPVPSPVRVPLVYDAYDDNTDSKSSKSKFISRFDPDNIFFQVPEWKSMDSKDTMYHISQQNHERQTEKPMHKGNTIPEPLPFLSSNETHHTNGSESPKLNTRYVEDKDGNLIKITEVEKKRSETREYEDDTPQPVYQPWGVEQMPEANYLDVNLLSEPVIETVVIEQDDDNDSDTTLCDYGPEVISETSKHLQAVQYSDQTRSLGITEPDDVELQLRLKEYEEKEKSMGITDDDSGVPSRQTEQFLYDARTATLRPVVTREGGRKLMQYSIGDTMITEL